MAKTEGKEEEMLIELYASDLNQEFGGGGATAPEEKDECVGNGPNPYYNGTDYAVPPLGDEFLFRREAFGGLIYDRKTGRVYKLGKRPYSIVQVLRMNRELIKSRGQQRAVIGALFPAAKEEDVDEFFAKINEFDIAHLVPVPEGQ